MLAWRARDARAKERLQRDTSSVMYENRRRLSKRPGITVTALFAGAFAYRPLINARTSW